SRFFSVLRFFNRTGANANFNFYGCSEGNGFNTCRAERGLAVRQALWAGLPGPPTPGSARPGSPGGSGVEVDQVADEPDAQGHPIGEPVPAGSPLVGLVRDLTHPGRGEQVADDLTH